MTISNLDPNTPPFDGPAGLGDDEIRQLKADLIDQFQGEPGDLYDIPLVVGPRSLNLVNDKANQADLDALDARVSTLETNDAIQDLAITDHEARIQAIEADYTTADEAGEIAWPIGAIFTSFDGATPTAKGLPGTWSAIGVGRVLLGASSAFGTEAGDMNKTLTAAQLPGHKHKHITPRHQSGQSGAVPSYASTNPSTSFNETRQGTNSPNSEFTEWNTDEGIGVSGNPFDVTPAHVKVAFYHRTA